MAVDQREAIFALLERSRRSFVPLRRAFVQSAGDDRGAGPLASFTKRERTLDLYLLLHALASTEPWDVVLSGRVWVRLLGLSEKSPAVGSWLSRQWAWLQEQGLVATERAGRNRRVVLRREDGSCEPYSHPGLGVRGSPPEGNYFRLPHAYWEGSFDTRLTLSGKLVLLVALSLEDDFILPLEHASRWYGLSIDRLHQGLRELRATSILDMRTVRRSAPLTDRGFTFERHYTLRAPFWIAELQDLQVSTT